MRARTVRVFNPHLLLGAVVLSLLLVLAACYFIIVTTRDVNEQNRQYLKEISAKNASEIKGLVNEEIDTLHAVVNIISRQSTFSMEQTLHILKMESERRTFKRLGFIPPDGNAVTTDDVKMNLLDRVYYQKALAGESNVSDRLADKIGGGFINVYAVPLSVEDRIEGVVIATVDNTRFADLISVDFFSGEGFAYIIKQDGTPVVYTRHKNSITEFQNLFEEMRNNGISESEIVKIEQNMREGKSGIVEYRRVGINRIAAYTAVGVNDWYVFSVVPKEAIFYYTNRLISRNVAVVVTVAALFILFIVVFVTQSGKNKRSLERLAFVDPLTDGHNLNKFKLIVAEALEKWRGEPLSIMCVDVDNFKLINDMYGVAQGNAVLLDMYRVLKGTLSERDVLARMGADDFLILLVGYTKEEILTTEQSFRSLFREQLTAQNKPYNISITSGIYLVQPGESDVQMMLDRVNMAHRSAKLLLFDPKLSFYSEQIRNDAVRIKRIEDTMQDALDQGEFCVYLQPKFEILNNHMNGAEALVRWIKEDRVVPPSEFVPLFEKNGFITKLDLYMMEQVCQKISAWLEQGLTPPVISVNFSRLHLRSDSFVSDLCQIADDHHVPRHLLEVEITESTMLENESVLLAVLNHLHAEGFLISMDDFGSGYSSLGLLKNIPVDVIKIDRSFFLAADDDKRARAVLSNVIHLAKDLQIHTVAEGVEDQTHIDLLRELGCDMVQGYYYAKPMPTDEFVFRMLVEKTDTTPKI